jgi:DNA-binding Xre family transcriptional regulator
MKINIKQLQILMANRIITINELAEKTKISRVHIGRFLSGKNTTKPATVGKIAKALNVKVEDLIEA